MYGEITMRIRMFPNKNDGEWGCFATILCVLGVLFPPIGILLLIIAWLTDYK